jgi:hypothetical protein
VEEGDIQRRQLFKKKGNSRVVKLPRQCPLELGLVIIVGNWRLGKS